MTEEPKTEQPKPKTKGLNLHFQKEQIKEYMAVLVLGMLFGLLLS